MTKPTNIDWARLAAFIDGEGCISCYEYDSNDGSYFNFTVKIYNADARLPLWLESKFGGRVVKQINKTKPDWRPSYAWVVGAKEAETLLKSCLPYFVLKVEQAEAALKYLKTLGAPSLPPSKESLVIRREQIIKLRDLKRTDFVTALAA